MLNSFAIGVAFTLTLAAHAAGAQHTGHPAGHGGHGAHAPARKAAPKPAAKAAPKKGGASADSAQRRRATTPTAPPAPKGKSDTATASPRSATGHEHHHPAAVSPETTRADTTVRPAAAATVSTASAEAHAEHAARRLPTERRSAPPPVAHDMWMRRIGGGWHLMGMAQVFPTLTAGSARQESGYLSSAGVYATQPAVMANLASPSARFVLRTTLNFEELTQENGELTYGGWGEGFIDARHPHTLLHEAMLSVNLWRGDDFALSLSAGKGFAPYGTDDPMGRPAIKFPTNHHLSQVLERFTANAQLLAGSWSLEAGVFGGAEPKDAYDFSNIESFGDSWSARLAKRFGTGADVLGPNAPWELSTSHAYVEEAHHGKTQVTRLYNASLRHDGSYDFGSLYAMGEWSRSKPAVGRGYYAALGEAQLGLGRERRHQPYARVEYATRPEYERLGPPGTPEFFRYDHDAHAVGSTRWLVNTVGYGYASSALPVSVRPYLEAQHNTVRAGRGDVDPRALYGARGFWSLSAGARVFFGGGPMRMGSYGALDPMTATMRPRASEAASRHAGH